MYSTSNKSPDFFLTQQAFHHIQNNIINGTLQPGNLISVTQIYEQLKTGNHPLKEALSNLVKAGLIAMHDDQTFTVVPITESMVRDLCTTLLQIEDIAITQSIANGTSCWEKEIHRTLQALDNAIHQSDIMEWNLLTERNEDFHYAIVANCNSPTLLELRSHLYLKFNTVVKLFIKSVPDKTYILRKQEEHKMIAQAALNRDAKSACSLNYYHIIGSLKNIIDVINKIEQIA